MKSRLVGLVWAASLANALDAPTVDARHTIMNAYQSMARHAGGKALGEMRRYYARDCVVVSMGVRYRFWDAAKPVAERKNGPHGFHDRIHVDRLRIDGDQAVAYVSSWGEYWAPMYGKMRHFTGHSRSVETWRRRSGRWQIVQVQTSGMAMDANPPILKGDLPPHEPHGGRHPAKP